MPSVDDSVVPDIKTGSVAPDPPNGDLGGPSPRGREMNGHYAGGLPRAPRSRSIARTTLVDRDDDADYGSKSFRRKAFDDLPPSRTAATPLEYTPAHVMAHQSYAIARMGVLTEISEINDFMFLSGVQPLRLDRIKAKKISLIVNATMDEPNVYLQGVDSLKIRVQDSPSALLSVYFDQDGAHHFNPASSAVTATCVGVLTEISEINDFMFLSGVQPLRLDKIKAKKISLIVNATMDEPNVYLQGVDSLKIRVQDSPSALLSVYFDQVADRIKKERDAGGKVLVHCVAGISRSTSLILAYMVKHERMALRDAFMRVKSRRSIVRPNPGFWRQLIDYEARVRGRASVKFVPSKWGDYVPDVYTDQIAHSTRLSSTIDSLGRALSSAGNEYSSSSSSSYTGSSSPTSYTSSSSNGTTNPSLFPSRYSTGILSNSTYSRLYGSSNSNNTSYLPPRDSSSSLSSSYSSKSSSTNSSYRYPHRSLTLPVSPFYSLNNSLSNGSSAPTTPLSPNRSSYRSIYANGSSSRGTTLSPNKSSVNSLISPLSTMYYSDLLYKT